MVSTEQTVITLHNENLFGRVKTVSIQETSPFSSAFLIKLSVLKIKRKHGSLKIILGSMPSPFPLEFDYGDVLRGSFQF